MSLDGFQSHLSGRSHLWTLVADPVGHVRAPSFVNPMFARRGLDGYLVPLHIRPADLASCVRSLTRVGNIKGIIVTIPHKVAMAQLCDELGESARLIGAVNTVRVEADGRLVGDMFDGLGLLATARSHGIEPGGRSVLLVGTGGAGSAIAFAMAAAGVSRLGLANRTVQRAERLAARVASAFSSTPVSVVPADARGFDLVVNCTSLGLKAGDPLPLDVTTLDARVDVIDIIAVRETELMASAAARGCRVVGGRPMIELQFDEQLRFIGMPPALTPSLTPSTGTAATDATANRQEPA